MSKYVFFMQINLVFMLIIIFRVALIKTIARIFSDPDTRHVVLKHVDPYTLQVVFIIFRYIVYILRHYGT